MSARRSSEAKERSPPREVFFLGAQMAKKRLLTSPSNSQRAEELNVK
jgi:hypothetical protein